MMFTTTKLAHQSYKILLLRIRSMCDQSPLIREVTLRYIPDKSRYQIPITEDDRVGRIHYVRFSKLKF